MCGRTTHLYTRREVWELYQLATVMPQDRPPADYNVPPTRAIPAVRIVDGIRDCSLLRWGLVPFWAKGVAPKYSTISARIETVETAASYRGPWKRGERCILPISGFYEWQILEDGKSKQPFYITCADQEIFGLAGLWDRSLSAEGEAVESCTIITMPANPLMSVIHNGDGANKHRMPAILAHEDSEA